METIELSEVCYEHIKDNYYYGIFGDFKLVIDKTTGYFNATKLCDQGGKRFRNWMSLEKSKRLLDYYGSRRWDPSADFLYEFKGTNNNKLNSQITGTYVPKEFILDIASWISIEFYDKCNNIILNYFVKEFKKMDTETLQLKIKQVEDQMEKLTIEKNEELKVKNDKIDELKEIMLRQEQYMRSLGISLEEVKDQNEDLKKKADNIQLKADNIQRKLGIAVQDRAPLPEDKSKRERFVLMKRNDSDYYPYYTIRAQYSYTTRKLKTERRHFPNLEILLDFKCNPNSKTLYTRIKENLKAKGVVFNGNNIDLEGTSITEQNLIEEMKVINDTKLSVE